MIGCSAWAWPAAASSRRCRASMPAADPGCTSSTRGPRAPLAATAWPPSPAVPPARIRSSSGPSWRRAPIPPVLVWSPWGRPPPPPFPTAPPPPRRAGCSAPASRWSASPGRTPSSSAWRAACPAAPRIPISMAGAGPWWPMAPTPPRWPAMAAATSTATPWFSTTCSWAIASGV